MRLTLKMSGSKVVGVDTGPVIRRKPMITTAIPMPSIKGVQKQAGAIARLTGAAIEVSPGCCGESGMGAIASPLVYNTLRKRKMDVLEAALADYPAQSPILVGCPSCKVGITRSLMAIHERRPVLHTVEWLATLLFRERWGEKWIRVFRRRIAPSADAQGVRIVELDG